MFSSGSVHNQVFLPLSHIATLLGSARSPINPAVTGRSHRNHNHQSINNEFEITCSESFQQAVKNCTEIHLEEGILKHLKSGGSLDPWKVSHISSRSFFENKHGFSEVMLAQYVLDASFPAPLPRFTRSLLRIPTPFNLDVHKRLFRSKRGEEISSNLGRSFGLGKRMKPDSSHDVLSNLFGLRFIRDKQNKGKLMSEAAQTERLRTLLADGTLPHSEQDRIKVAFAEGYLAAEGKGKAGTKLKIFNVFRDLLGIVLIVAILFTFMGGTFRVQIGNSNEVHPEEISITFGDVKGVDEAKNELQEVVEFLRNPEKFSALGGKLPKGVLLVGPPGTGKTLLARAVAGEARVPFFHAAGPEFDEILVGQGARRVRDLFSTAKLRAPCVVFIDEIDSVGAKRTSSVLHPYANQTINQLLSEMDGFRQNEGVIVLGATNRREDLDKALLRPGRFDVEIQVPPPDLVGRKEILAFYLGKVKYGSDVDIDVLARGTTGFTGADLENLVNQAAVRAASDSAVVVTMKYLENARDKVLMGPERKSRIPDEEANLITAYHEGGHALVAHYTKDAHPLHKVTIVPRGPSLGHTAYIPEKERYHITKAQMLATMDTLMGGRAAEELIFGAEKITSGASSDLNQATSLATQMVKELGMSEKVGVRTFEDNSASLVVVKELSNTTSEAIDSEIRRLLTESYDRAKNILKNHAKEHKSLAEALLKYETLDADDIKALLGGKNKDELK